MSRFDHNVIISFVKKGWMDVVNKLVNIAGITTQELKFTFPNKYWTVKKGVKNTTVTLKPKKVYKDAFAKQSACDRKSKA